MATATKARAYTWEIDCAECGDTVRVPEGTEPGNGWQFGRIDGPADYHCPACIAEATTFERIARPTWRD